ncbi:MAG: hypothetical protein RJA36_1470 [Pseudomonadota bacterium]|jgi:hypothetical protein
MPRPPRFSETYLIRWLPGTLARIRALLAAGETTGQLIRAAIDRELARRQQREDADGRG